MAEPLRYRRRRLDRPADFVEPLPDSAAWGALNSLLGGVLLGGVAGWLLGRWLDASWITAVGLIAGMALGITSVWFRYGYGRTATAVGRNGDEPEPSQSQEPSGTSATTKENG